MSFGVPEPLPLSAQSYVNRLYFSPRRADAQSFYQLLNENYDPNGEDPVEGSLREGEMITWHSTGAPGRERWYLSARWCCFYTEYILCSYLSWMSI